MKKTGALISIKSVTDLDDLMIITRSGLTVRLAVESIRIAGRATQGVKLISLRENEMIAAVASVIKSSDDDDEEPSEDEGDTPVNGDLEGQE